MQAPNYTKAIINRTGIHQEGFSPAYDTLGASIGEIKIELYPEKKNSLLNVRDLQSYIDFETKKQNYSLQLHGVFVNDFEDSYETYLELDTILKKEPNHRFSSLAIYKKTREEQKTHFLIREIPLIQTEEIISQFYSIKSSNQHTFDSLKGKFARRQKQYFAQGKTIDQALDRFMYAYEQVKKQKNNNMRVA